MDFLREDLTHLFDDRGIDQSQYDDVVRWQNLHSVFPSWHACVQLARKFFVCISTLRVLQVQFRDPITSYNDVKGALTPTPGVSLERAKVDIASNPVSRACNVSTGYMFNIGMLKRVFAPDFILHDIKQTGEFEVTTRWTMEVPLLPSQQQDG